MLRAKDAYNLSHKTWGQLKQVEMGIREATRLGATEILINAVVAEACVLHHLTKAGYVVEREDDMYRIRWDSPARALEGEAPNQGSDKPLAI